MTKGELIQFLEPFTDDAPIYVTSDEYLWENQANRIFSIEYRQKAASFGGAILIRYSNSFVLLSPKGINKK